MVPLQVTSIILFIIYLFIYLLFKPRYTFNLNTVFAQDTHSSYSLTTIIHISRNCDFLGEEISIYLCHYFQFSHFTLLVISKSINYNYQFYIKLIWC